MPLTTEITTSNSKLVGSTAKIEGGHDGCPEAILGNDGLGSLCWEGREVKVGTQKKALKKDQEQKPLRSQERVKVARTGAFRVVKNH